MTGIGVGPLGRRWARGRIRGGPLEVDGGVAIVTLNARDRRNALTPAMAHEPIATFDEVDAKPEVGALVMRAVGKLF
jgi:enoyl-CoA hydratase/carnithine racemase